MKYSSTRGGERDKSSIDAILQGIASDKGLFVPEKIPELPFDMSDMVNKPYKEIAFQIIGAFFPDLGKESLHYCVDNAYDEKFEKEEIVPVRKVGEVNFLELYHGKTAAFKDMALSILPYFFRVCMQKKKEDKKICILTATSGDTGKAALEGFADVAGTEIIVFYPNAGVSEVQERQMVTQKGKNTHVFAIEGNFDDAQTGVKKIFNDPAFAKKALDKGVKLSSANSINIGRLVPQVAYYVYGYLSLVADGQLEIGQQMNVVVPTGNFGNILAAYYAKKMGTPIDKLICASNENKVLTDFFKSGRYDIDRPFHLTNSPSMDILISSNLERLLYDILDGNSEKLVNLMKDLENNKSYRLDEQARTKLKDFAAGFATVAETNETIGKIYEEYGYLVDTHTAVAYKVYRDFLEETGNNRPTLIASTASPYKFAESVSQSIGLAKSNSGFESILDLHKKTNLPIPNGLKDLDKAEILHGSKIKISEMPETVLNSL